MKFVTIGRVKQSQQQESQESSSLAERVVSEIPGVAKEATENAYNVFKRKLAEIEASTPKQNSIQGVKDLWSVAKGIGRFAYSIPKFAARAAITGAQSVAQIANKVGITNNYGDSINPKEFGVEGILGEEPIVSIQDKMKASQLAVKELGGTKFEQNTYPVMFAVGGTILDAWVGGGSKQAAKPIIKNIEKRLGRKLEKEAVEQIAKDIEEKTAAQSFKRLRTSDQHNAVTQIYAKALTEQVDKEVSRRIGVETSESVKKSIMDNIQAIALLNNEADEKEAIGKFIDDIVSSYPKAKAGKKPYESTNNQLLAEARKYESAEEFVKAKTNAFHQTNENITEFNKDKPTFFNTFKRPATYGGNTVESFVDYKKPFEAKTFYWTQEEQGIKFPKLKKKGYDAVIFRNPEDSRIQSIVSLNPLENTKTKSQLVDIWEQASKLDAAPKTVAKQLEEKAVISAARKQEREANKFLKSLEKQLTKEIRQNNTEEVTRIKAQIKAAKKSAKEAMAKAKKATGELPISKTQKVINDNTVNRAFKSPRVVRSERTLLKERFKLLRQGAASGKRVAIKEGRAFRKAVRDYASDLPLQVRQTILSKKALQEITSEKKLKLALDKVDQVRNKFSKETERLEVLRSVMPLKKLAREKKVLGKVNKQAGKEFARFKTLEDGTKVRVAFNNGMLRSASIDELKRYEQLLKEAMDGTPVIAKGDYANAAPGRLKSEFVKTVKDGIEKNLGILSTNIRKYGGDELMYAFRRREENIIKYTNQFEAPLKAFNKDMKKLNRTFFGNKKDYNRFSAALFNQDFDTAREIARKHKFSETFEQVVKMLEKIQDDLVANGVKVGKLPNYFPRSIKSYNDYYIAVAKKYGKDGTDYLDRILNDASKLKFGAALTDAEKFDILTNTMRGYGDRLNLGSKFKNSRQVKIIEPEFMKFYLAPEEALIKYVAKAIDEIHTAGLFKQYGKKGVTEADADSIGKMVSGLNLTPDNAARLKEVIFARLARQQGEGAVRAATRQAIYITTLSHITSIITQLADPALYLRKGGKLFRYFSSFFGKKPYKMNELFGNVLLEMDGGLTNKALFGLAFTDSLLGNAGIKKLYKDYAIAAKKGKGSLYKDLEKKAKYMFATEEEGLKLIDDLKNRKLTDRTRTFMFNEISDISPRTILEMPEEYAKSPKKRIFYTLKSWSLKALDTYRNEVVREAKNDKMKAAKNFIMLTALLSLSGATTNQIKAWWSGKEEDWSDSVADGMLNILMLSRYDEVTAKNDGLYSALISKIVPAGGWINDASKDIMTAGDGKGVYSIRNVPFIGKEIYNRLGRGQESIQKNNKKIKTERLLESMKDGKLTTSEKQELVKLKKENPAKYSILTKKLRWHKMGLSDKEVGFASMGVSDGERAKAILQYIKSQKNKNATYRKLREAGIITSEVNKQLVKLNKK